MPRTCEDTGHHCALKSLLYLRIITQAQYDCLLKLDNFCVPGIGTNPSSILKLMNGIPIIDANGKNCMDSSPSLLERSGINFRSSMDYSAADESSGQEHFWLRCELSSSNDIQDKLFNEILKSPFGDSRLMLHLEDGIKGHYSIFTGDRNNSYVIDSFDPNLESWLGYQKKIPFTQTLQNKRKLDENKKLEEYIFFLVDINELIPKDEIVNRDQLMFKYYGPGIHLIDTKGCEMLEKHIMASLTEDQKACIAESAAGYLRERERPTKKRGGKTNTKKKYRAKTLVSINKNASRHRIRRSRRKSKSNRINNGKH